MKVKADAEHVYFRCPGCKDMHIIPIAGPSRWEWNGNVDQPTLGPSILVRSGHYAPHWKPGDNCWCGKDYGFSCYICHSFVINGQIQFCGDSTHQLSGQTVPLSDYE
jgi:hypothetical protein